MANTNFGSILDRESSGKVDRPKALPVGTYLTVVKGLPKFDKSAKKGTEFVEFTMQIMQAMDDVDTEALGEALTKADGSRKSLSDMSFRNTYYLTEDALWRLDKFFKDIGILEAGKSRRQMCEEATGCQCLVNIKHTPSDDGENVFANIASTAPVE